MARQGIKGEDQGWRSNNEKEQEEARHCVCTHAGWWQTRRLREHFEGRECVRENIASPPLLY